MRNTISALLLGVMLMSCERPFEYSPYEVRIKDGYEDLTAKNLEKLGKQTAGSTVTVAVIGDSQRFYDDIDGFVKSVNANPDIDFVLHLGDISDFALAREFQWVHDDLKELRVPYLTVIGNHDLLANGNKAYRLMYGPEDYTFDFGGIRFAMMNTNSREYEDDSNLPRIDELKRFIGDTSEYDQLVVCGHVPPVSDDINQALVPIFNSTIANSGKAEVMLFGHDHRYYFTEDYAQNVDLLRVAAFDDREYVLMSFTAGSYDQTRITY